MAKYRWEDRPGQPICEGDYCRQVEPHNVKVVTKVSDLWDDWATFHVVKTNGERDRRCGGWSGSIAGHICVARIRLGRDVREAADAP